MTNEEWTMRLGLAMRYRDVPGDDVAQFLVELETHLLETGSSAFDEFGDPAAFADQVTERTGPTSTTKRRFTIFVLLSSVVWIAGFGIVEASDGRLTVPLNVILPGLGFLIATTFLMARLGLASGEVFEGRRRQRPVIFALLWTGMVVATVASVLFLPGVGSMTVPVWLLWSVVIIGGLYLITESLIQHRKRRIRSTATLPDDARQLLQSLEGPESWKRMWSFVRTAGKN